jgi:anti-sigma factor RsiW
MIRDHLSESEIQQYASGEIKPDLVAAGHMEQCKNCSTRMANYQLLFSAVEQAPRPVFDFDAVGLVMAQLPAPVRASTENTFLQYAVILIVTAAAVVPLWYFRKLFTNMAGSITSFSLYTIAAAGILIVFFKLLGMYKKYQKQIIALNFN